MVNRFVVVVVEVRMVVLTVVERVMVVRTVVITVVIIVVVMAIKAAVRVTVVVMVVAVAVAVRKDERTTPVKQDPGNAVPDELPSQPGMAHLHAKQNERNCYLQSLVVRRSTAHAFELRCRCYYTS